MSKHFFSVFLFTITWLIFSVSLAAVPTTPASYAVAVKWKENGHYYSRVGAYTFSSDGTFRADYWQWSTLDTFHKSFDRVVGTRTLPIKNDVNKRIVTESRFLGDESKMTTEFGVYVTFGNNTRIRIDWENGTREYWKRTWHDERLNKIELFYLDSADTIRDTYLFMNPATGRFSRNEDAVNAGFGFGAPFGFYYTGLHT